MKRQVKRLPAVHVRHHLGLVAHVDLHASDVAVAAARTTA
jgi:hypothetical protein